MSSFLLLGAGTDASAGGGGGGSILVDTSAHSNATSATPTVTLSTSGTNRVILVFILTNGGSVLSVSDTAALTWTHADTNSGGSDYECWWAPAAAQLTADVITVTTNSSAFATLDAVSVSGATSISAPFDGSASQHLGVGSDPLSKTTTATNTLVIAGFRFSATASPTAGAGFTSISGANFALVEYQSLSSSQTLSCTVGTGVGDANGSVAVAIK